MGGLFEGACFIVEDRKAVKYVSYVREGVGRDLVETVTRTAANGRVFCRKQMAAHLKDNLIRVKVNGVTVKRSYTRKLLEK